MAFCSSMSRSQDIVSFAVRDIRLDNESIHQLAIAISTTEYLKELEIKCCSLNTQYLSLISSAIEKNTSLIAVDLSKNFLTSGVLL